jgi:uncharacterized membrane protein YadS
MLENRSIPRLAPGIAVALAVALLGEALHLAQVRAGHLILDALVLAILLGMAIRSLRPLPDSWAPVFGFLQGSYLQFSPWKDIMQGSRDAYVFIPLALCICLFFKNSNQMAEKFKADWKSLFWIAAGAYAVLNMVKKTEFLYFNF